MPPTEDLHARILAAIEQTEEIAQITAGGGGLPDPVWTTEPSRSQTWQILRQVDDPTPIGYITDGRWQIRHIVRHAPAAVLRRCTADRRILTAHRTTVWDKPVHTVRLFSCWTCHRFTDEGTSRWWCETLLALADGYGITVDRPQ